MQIVISGPVIECYGLSETGPVTCTESGDNCFGHMGGPFASSSYFVFFLKKLKVWS